MIKHIWGIMEFVTTRIRAADWPVYVPIRQALTDSVSAKRMRMALSVNIAAILYLLHKRARSTVTIARNVCSVFI